MAISPRINVEGLKTAISNVKEYTDERIDSITLDVSSDIDTINSNVASVNSKISTINSSISTINSSLSDVDSSINEITTSIDALETSVAGKSDTSHTHSNYASTVTTTGSGNAVTGVSKSGNTVTVTKGSTFLTAHPTISKSTDTTSTASVGYGGTFTAVDGVTRDSNGHVTKINTKTVTLPSSQTIPTTLKNPNALTIKGAGTSVESYDGSAVGEVNVVAGSNVTVTASDGQIKIASTNTKNTAGSTNSSSKLFLIGATSQATNPQTYSHDTAYVGTDGCLYSNNEKVAVGGQGFYYIEGTGTTTGIWLGTHSDIKSYYAGLTVAYKIPIAGVSTGTTLNINDLGAVTVVRNATTLVGTAYAVNSIVRLTYTVDNGTPYWKIADYDANTTTTANSTNTSSKIFLIGATSQGSSKTTYSHDTAFVGTDGCLYSNSKKVSVEGHTHDTSNAKVTLSTSSWSGSAGAYTQTVSVSGVTATSIVVVAPTPAHSSIYGENSILCTAQSSGKLTFTANSVPTSSVIVNVINLGEE